MKELEQLIDTLLMQAESPRNQARKDSPAPHIFSYLENLGWVQYFGYDMNEFYDNAIFNCKTQIKQNLCQFERFDDDTVLPDSISASTGMYFEYTLLGMRVGHQPDGVPLIQSDHPLTKTADLSLMKKHDFHTTGDMPHVFRLYDELQAISKGRFNVDFPLWERGPLDLAIQLRGYEQLMNDTRERPQFVHDLMSYIIEERIRWWDAYCKHFNTSHRSAEIADDWLHIPFTSPAIFRDFVFPCYAALEEYHGVIKEIHSCGDKSPFFQLFAELKTMNGYEVNHWTDFEAAVRYAPPDKRLDIALLNTDVLLAPKQDMETELQRIKSLCKGRDYSVTASAIEKVHDDFEYDIRQVQIWIETARKVLRNDQ